MAALDAWLRERVDLPAGLPEVRQFRGGASNLTFLVRYPDRDLVMRRPPAGHKAASAHDMRREYEIQRMLAPWFPAVPEVLGYTDDPTVLGSEFYVMAHVPGLILRGDLPYGLALAPVGGQRPGAGYVRLPGRPALGGHLRQRPGRLLARFGLCAPPGRGLVGALSGGAHR